ncbi:Rho termination factor N-terminal domain-containing protein [Bacillus atrophaeus]|uniref:Rho termination factor N-terminal domain-containing protein n=1 Tax=Bacillus atrophaeus TaxID=1452 RepID=UPI0038113061
MGLASFNRMRRMKASDYDKMTLDELKEKAKEQGVTGYYNMKRETLLTKLKG